MAKEHKLKIGAPAPAFELESTNGKKVSLASLAGKKVVLYFYPKDDTPGCTREACSFRDENAALKKAGAIVLGVSKDSLQSHAKFRTKYQLPFDLLADPNNAVAQSYGAFGKKLMYGKEVTGTIRSTFLIDEHGKLAALWSPVKVDGHTEQVLAALRGDAPAKKSAAPSSDTVKQAAGKRPAAKAAAKGSTKPAKKSS
ncbi:MAG: thioredoxin-dependent thiol peroxidase [Planctomycetes bacterium]|nr:thioredoxin-dependent thiol peroxidase [Planctomycetota bacterium]